MYPTINLQGNNVSFSNPSALGPSPFGAAIASSTSPPDHTSTTSLRVVIAERFRVAPPVSASPASAPTICASPLSHIFDPGSYIETQVPAPAEVGLLGAGVGDAVGAPPASASFDYERRVLAELEGRAGHATAPAENGLPQQDRYEALLSQCVSNGCSREDAVLGLAVALAARRERVDSHAVVEAARKVRRLREMGFGAQAAAGALVAQNGDLQLAIDMASV